MRLVDHERPPDPQQGVQRARHQTADDGLGEQVHSLAAVRAIEERALPTISPERPGPGAVLQFDDDDGGGVEPFVGFRREALVQHALDHVHSR